MNWGNLSRQKKILLSLFLISTVAVAALFAPYAIKRFMKESGQSDPNLHAVPANIPGSPVMLESDSSSHTFFGDSTTSTLLAEIPPVTQGSGGTDSATFFGDGSARNSRTDNSDNDSKTTDDGTSPSANVIEADLDLAFNTGEPEGTSGNHSAETYLASNRSYPAGDHDLEVFATSSIVQGTGATQPEGGETPGSEPPAQAAPSADQTSHQEISSSQVPEPGTLFLIGSGLIGLAAFGRKLRKH